MLNSVTCQYVKDRFSGCLGKCGITLCWCVYRNSQGWRRKTSPRRKKKMSWVMQKRTQSTCQWNVSATAATNCYFHCWWPLDSLNRLVVLILLKSEKCWSVFPRRRPQVSCFIHSPKIFSLSSQRRKETRKYSHWPNLINYVVDYWLNVSALSNNVGSIILCFLIS